ncbi:MAG: hypothetical protein CFE24_01910 [Flavobacterium sp. BFFFF2]|nr:MAG: hypothetical protein CFE24_01910 [Flavobacterium sp. BFFFF2]
MGNNEVEMRQNNIPFWECPNCELQIIIEKGNAVILRHRGEGDFKYNLLKFNLDCVLEETDSDGYSTGIEILDFEHLENYLETKVQHPKEFSFAKLIDNYVNYKFENQSKENYIIQSEHFKIDFEDNSIIEELIKRDRNRNQNQLYAHSRLYRFLQIILEKYYKIDNSWLPEMGMSKIEHYLCTKHFPSDERKKINSNPLFVKQSLKELIFDLIRIIYLDQKTLLSYDPIELQEIEKEMK